MLRIPRTPQPIIWINGWPAVGRQTLAQCLSQVLGQDRAVLIDDRTYMDQVAPPPDVHIARAQPLMDVATGRVTADSEENVAKLEACLARYVLDPMADQRMVIFTDNRVNDEDGVAGAQRIAEAARQAKRPFVPLYVECAPEQHVIRRKSSDRYGVRPGLGECLSAGHRPNGVNGVNGNNASGTEANGSGANGNETTETNGTEAPAPKGTPTELWLRARMAEHNLYVFPIHEQPGLFVDVTSKSTHETAVDILMFINLIESDRHEEAVQASLVSSLVRPKNDSGMSVF